MNLISRKLWVLSLVALPLVASAGSITILSPRDGEVWGTGTHTLQYQVDPSANGNHLHVYVDDDDPIISHQLTHCPCSVELPALKPGHHRITIKEAESGHSLTGVQAQVGFSVK